MNDHSKIRGNSGGAGSSPIALGLVLGALFGVGVTLLLAPRTGSRSRRRLIDSSQRWGREARIKLRKARDSASALGRDVKTAAEGVRESAGR